MAQYATREGVILIKEEDAYGAGHTTPPAMGTDDRYVEEASITGQRNMITRNGPSPYRRGFPPVVGTAEADFSVKVEMTTLAISDTPSERPLETDFLKCAGFKPTGTGGGNPDYVTYALQSNPTGLSAGVESSFTIWAYEFNTDDDDGWLHKVNGCRGDFTLEITGDERWFFTVSGKGSNYSHTSIGASRSSTGIPVYDFDTTPMVGGRASCIVKAITANETYPAAGRVVSFSVTGNNNPTLRKGVCGQRADLAGSDYVTAELVLEVEDPGDFDPWQYQGQTGASESLNDAVLVQIAGPSDTLTFSDAATLGPSGGTSLSSYNYVGVRMYGYITNIAVGDDGGAKIWTLSLQGAYVVNGDLAGETPSEGIVNIIYGTYTTP